MSGEGSNVTFNGKTVITTGSGGRAFTEDPCYTGPNNQVVHYKNVCYAKDAKNPAKGVFINGHPVCHADTVIAKSYGDEAGTGGGVKSGTTQGEARFVTSMASITIEGKPAVCNMDQVVSNHGNTAPNHYVQSNGPLPQRTQAQLARLRQAKGEAAVKVEVIAGTARLAGELQWGEDEAQALPLNALTRQKPQQFLWQLDKLEAGSQLLYLHLEDRCYEYNQLPLGQVPTGEAQVRLVALELDWATQLDAYPTVANMLEVWLMQAEHMQDMSVLETNTKLAALSAREDRIQQSYHHYLGQYASLAQLPAETWIYVYVDGHLWRELQKVDNGYRDVNLKHNKGHDDRKATGCLVKQIVVPQLLAGRAPTVEIATSQAQWPWGLVEHYGGLAPFDPRARKKPYYESDSVARLRAQPPKWQRAERMTDITKGLADYADLGEKVATGKLYLAGKRIHYRLPDRLLLAIQLSDAIGQISSALQQVQAKAMQDPRYALAQLTESLLAAKPSDQKYVDTKLLKQVTRSDTLKALMHDLEDLIWLRSSVLLAQSVPGVPSVSLLWQEYRLDIAYDYDNRHRQQQAIFLASQLLAHQFKFKATAGQVIQRVLQDTQGRPPVPFMATSLLQLPSQPDFKDWSQAAQESLLSFAEWLAGGLKLNPHFDALVVRFYQSAMAVASEDQLKVVLTPVQNQVIANTVLDDPGKAGQVLASRTRAEAFVPAETVPGKSQALLILHQEQDVTQLAPEQLFRRSTRMLQEVAKKLQPHLMRLGAVLDLYNLALIGNQWREQKLNTLATSLNLAGYLMNSFVKEGNEASEIKAADVDKGSGPIKNVVNSSESIASSNEDPVKPEADIKSAASLSEQEGAISGEKVGQVSNTEILMKGVLAKKLFVAANLTLAVGEIIAGFASFAEAWEEGKQDDWKAAALSTGEALLQLTVGTAIGTVTFGKALLASGMPEAATNPYLKAAYNLVKTESWEAEAGSALGRFLLVSGVEFMSGILTLVFIGSLIITVIELIRAYFTYTSAEQYLRHGPFAKDKSLQYLPAEKYGRWKNPRAAYADLYNLLFPVKAAYGQFHEYHRQEVGNVIGPISGSSWAVIQCADPQIAFEVQLTTAQLVPGKSRITNQLQVYESATQQTHCYHADVVQSQFQQGHYQVSLYYVVPSRLLPLLMAPDSDGDVRFNARIDLPGNGQQYLPMHDPELDGSGQVTLGKPETNDE